MNNTLPAKKSLGSHWLLLATEAEQRKGAMGRELTDKSDLLSKRKINPQRMSDWKRRWSDHVGEVESFSKMGFL